MYGMLMMQEYEAGDDEELSPEDEKALAAFMAPDADAYRQTSLGDLVLAKLREEQKDRGLDVLPEWVQRK
jgi:essential nuclear protein 1